MQRSPKKLAMTERRREDAAYNLFVARVIRVDYERNIVSLLNQFTNESIDSVSCLPCSASSAESTEIVTPEIGSLCIACNFETRAGFANVAIVTWITSGSLSGIDAIATRPLDDVPGRSNRVRGVYRKTYPGDRTTVLTDGYTEKHDDGWDKTSADFAREKQDPFRRSKIMTNGRELSFNDSGLSMTGFVHRPGASATDISPLLLPDGSQEWILYLSGTTQDGTTRYTKGTPDMIPLVENTKKISEFALDYTIPIEALETSLMDTILGTTQDPWSRTTITTDPSGVAYDNESFMINQGWDHPTSGSKQALGPTLKEGSTPQRRAWMIEKSEGTFVGSNIFDASTYGKVLKPVIFSSKFGTDTSSSYTPVNKSADQVETRLAASAHSLRFPYETNTTRLDITKEGMVTFEIGSTLPKENIPIDKSTYEYPWGAGRSVEGNILGSVRLVVGKNREEEDALDITALGSTVIRLGADDTILPNTRRNLQTQIRGQKDTIGNRTLQSWAIPKQVNNKNVVQGDCGDLVNKVAMENVSLRAATDGGMFLRLGARHGAVKRRHLMNGYADGQGRTMQPITASTATGRIDSRSPGRPTYSPITTAQAGNAYDSSYQFHDLTKVGQSTFPSSQPDVGPYVWSGDPITGPSIANSTITSGMDTTGLSADIHAVRDVLLRIGKNTQNNQSLLLDLDGGIVAAVGTDTQGRSLTAALDGGIEGTIGSNKAGKAVRLEIDGDIDLTINGNLQLNVTGDIVVDGVRILHTAKLSHTVKSCVIATSATVMHIEDTPNKVPNSGLRSAVDPIVH